MKLALNQQSSSAVREFADSIPIAIENIVTATEQLAAVYQSVADTLGVHNQDFYEMLMHIKKAQENASNAIQVLPPMMISTADKIDFYVATHPTYSGQ